MLEILKNKKCDKTNGTINFCIISEEEKKEIEAMLNEFKEE